MTEEQAKTKWCPMVRAGTHGANYYVAGNWRGGTIAEIDAREYTRCQGSACMMWRWTRPPEGVRVRDEIHQSSGAGYCGMAGTERPTP